VIRWPIWQLWALVLLIALAVCIACIADAYREAHACAGDGLCGMDVIAGYVGGIAVFAAIVLFGAAVIHWIKSRKN
jgi:hypothetical protein